MRKLLSIILSYTLFIIQVPLKAEEGLLDNLDEEQKAQLKNITISDSLKESLKAYPATIKVNLTEEDRKALRLLGYSDNEIDQLNADTFDSDTFKRRLKSYSSKKKTELDKGVNSSLVPGLASSIIGLAFASMLGLVVGVRCSNQPSALAFAASSAAWVALEMTIWKGYQIRMDDIETLQKATEIPEMIDSKVQRAKEIIENLEKSYEANPTGNFEAFLERHKDEVDELRTMATELRDFLQKAKDKQFGALRSIHESIELAAQTSKKKARNAKVAAIGFTAASGLAAAEAFNVFNAAGTCANAKTSFLPFALIPSAHAASIGDLDKIGIPVGAGLGAAYLGFKKTFADKIYNSATSRGIVFLAMAGIAVVAAKKLKEAAKFLQKQADEMGIFVDAIEQKFEKMDIAFGDADALIDELKEELLPQIEEIADSAKEELQEEVASLTDEEVQVSEEKLEELINKNENFSLSDIKSELDNGVPELDPSEIEGRLQSSLYWFERLFLITEANAVASTPPKCFKRTPTFLRFDESCQCRQSQSCGSTPYPRSVNLKKMNSGLKSFSEMAFSSGALVSQSSNAILHGLERKGLSGFGRAQSATNKLNTGSKRLLSQKIKKKVNSDIIARTMMTSFSATKPALKDYYKKRALKGNSIRIPQKLSKKLAKVRIKPKSDIRGALRLKIMALKKLGNKSVKDFSARSNQQDYDYSKEAITKDPDKDLFGIIKRRYLIIKSQGRL